MEPKKDSANWTRIWGSANGAGLLYVSAMLIGIPFAWQRMPLTLTTLIWVSTVPAAAALVIMAFCISMPSLFSSKRWHFPMQFTLPAVHCVAMLMLTVLLMNPSNPLFKRPPPIRPIWIWSQASVLSTAYVLQVFGATLLFRPKFGEPEPTEQTH